jgi:hypothetical protein
LHLPVWLDLSELWHHRRLKLPASTTAIITLTPESNRASNIGIEH